MIIESGTDYKNFLRKFEVKDSILIPIFCDAELHPQENELSLLYVMFFDEEDYILPFNHGETLNLTYEHLEKLYSCESRKFIYDKKSLSHLTEFKYLWDVNLLHYMAKNEPLYIDEIDTTAHRFFNMRYFNKKNINTIIPVLKHLERCRKIANIIKVTAEKYEEYVNMSYNNDVLDNLTYIEKSGLQAVDKILYSQYNIYTSTGRPSNRFGGINFAALNKTDGSRRQFVSRFENGMLVEMDYDGYHLRLIADKVDYTFPEGSVHQHMAELYGTDYDTAKGISFQYLYGSIPKNIAKENKFFSKVQNYIDKLWKLYKTNDFIVSDIYSKTIYRKNLIDMNKNKLFNYTIQLMETENNMSILSQLIPEIKKNESKLVLYSYDSFLFDFNMGDGLNYLKKVKKIIEQDGKFPVKVNCGMNYHGMEDITEKFA